MKTCTGLVAALATCVVLSAGARADTLILKDGRRFEGKLLQKDDRKVVFESHLGASRMRVEFSAADVLTITEGPVAAASRPASRPASPSTGGLELPPAPEPPAVVKYDKPTYYLIPAHGQIGRTATAPNLEASLADAARRSPAAVVLEVDSPGGMIAEVEPIFDSLRQHGKTLRVVVYVRKHAISAAAVLSFGAKEIYMHPAGLIGAATAYRMDEEGMPEDISEKMQSVWRAQARSGAELGGHSLLLAEAMIDRNLQLHWVEEGGQKVVKEGKGTNMITRQGRLLTLTAGEALACGLSAGTVEGVEELGKRLGHAGWTECKGLGTLLAEHRAKTVDLVDEAFKKLRESFQDNMREAHKNDPTEYTYTVWSHNQKFTPESQRLWQQRSGICARFLLSAEKNIKDARELAEKFPHLMTDPEMLREWEKEVAYIRKRILEGTYKKSPVTE